MIVFHILGNVEMKKQDSDWEKHLILYYTQNKK